MKLHAIFLADAAMQNADGTFMVWRGGITEVTTSVIPAPANFTLVLRIEMDRQEAEELHEFQLRIEHEGQEIVPLSSNPLAAKIPPNEPRGYLNVQANLRFVIPVAGEGFIESMIDGSIRLPLLYFRVHHVPGLFIGSGPPTGGPLPS